MPMIRDLPKIEGVLKIDGRVEFVVLRFEHFKKFIQKCDLNGDIDEADYLQRYPDVARAIKKGTVADARTHYLNSGYAEQRSAKVRP